MNGSYTKLMSAIGARGSNGAGAPGMSKSWLAGLAYGRSDDAVLGEVTQLFQACNDGYVLNSYATVFKRHFWRPKDPVPHPLWKSSQ